MSICIHIYIYCVFVYVEQGIGTIIRIETQGEVMVKWDATGLEHTYLGIRKHSIESTPSSKRPSSSGTLLPSEGLRPKERKRIY